MGNGIQNDYDVNDIYGAVLIPKRNHQKFFNTDIGGLKRIPGVQHKPTLCLEIVCACRVKRTAQVPRTRDASRGTDVKCAQSGSAFLSRPQCQKTVGIYGTPPKQ